MSTLLTFIGLAVAGIIIGLFSGLLGVGGGTIMVPVLRLVFQLSAYAAAATSLFTMIFTSIAGSLSHLQQRTSIPLLGLALGVGGALTSPLGVFLGSISPGWAIMLAAAVVIAYSAFKMLRKAIRMPKAPHPGSAEEKKDGASEDGTSAVCEEVDFSFSWKKILGGFGIGLIAGLCAGYIGVGGGFIMVPLMTAWLGVPMRKASGTSLIAIIILAIPGVIEQSMLGNVDYLAGIAMAIGSIPGAIVGARLVKRIPERQLRFVFAAFLAVAAVVLVLNEFGII